MSFNLPKGAVLIDSDTSQNFDRPSVEDQIKVEQDTTTTTQLPKDAVIIPPSAEGLPSRQRQPNIIEKSMQSGYLGRIGEDLQQRIERVERGTQAFQEGEIGYPQYALYGFANAWGALADVVGESALTALGALPFVDARDLLEETIAAGGTKLMETDAAKAALEFYNTLTPQQQDLVGNVAEISLGAMPGKKIGQSVKKSGIQADKNKMANWVLDQSSTAREERISQGAKPKNMQNRLNKEERILDTLVSLDVKGNTKPTTALNKISFEVNRLGNKVNTSLKEAYRKNRTRVPARGVEKAVDFRLNGFLANNKRFVEDKRLSGYVSKAKTALADALEKYDGSPKSLLKLRRNFDNNIKDVLAEDIFDGPNVSARPVREMREAINDLMLQLAPNDDIRAMMRRQHYLLDAERHKTVNEAKKSRRNLAEKAMGLAERHPFVAASFVSGGGMFNQIPEGLVLGGAGALGAYGLAQPGVRRVTGQSLSDLPVMRGIGMTAATPDEDKTQ